MSHLQLIPNGEQVFVDANGEPYALGTVGMYVPNTLNDKDTWQDRDHVALNTNPIDLDAAGRCVIWGEGAYRQILKDLNGNTIWDRITQVFDVDEILPAATVTEVLEGVATDVAVTPDALAALWEQGANIASAGTISVGEGGLFHITGAVTITDIDFAVDKAGREATLVFDSALTLTHGASLILPSAANIVTAAGDVAIFRSEGSDVARCVNYMRASGEALVVPSSGALTLIQEVVTSGSQADVTFSSIPATYRDLEICIRGRGTTAAVEIPIHLQFNGDTAANYHAAVGVADGVSCTSAQNLSQTAMERLMDIPAASATASYAGSGVIVIGNYRGTTFFKSACGLSGQSRSSASQGTRAEIGGGIWLSTAAINAVKVFPAAGAWVDNSVVSLYGRM